MKIYDLEGFLRLPAGTIFAKVLPHFGLLSVKGENIGEIDFYSRSLVGIAADDSGELFERYEAMKAEGASFPIEDSEGRDGSFERDALFLVYERDDLRTLAQDIATALALPITIEGER